MDRNQWHSLCRTSTPSGTRHFCISFLLPSWRAVRSYRPHLEDKDPIWGDDSSHSPFIRWSPSWDFLRFSSAVRQMPWDLCPAPRIISLSPLSLVTDAILGASGLWLGTWTGAGGTATLTESFFGCSPWLHGQQIYTFKYKMKQFLVSKHSVKHSDKNNMVYKEITANNT